MGLDQHIVDEVVALIRRRFPDWQGFGDPAFTKDECAYKSFTIEKAIGADGLLTEAALRADLEGSAHESFITRFQTIGTDNNLLYRSIPRESDLLILNDPPEDKQALCEHLLDLVWGPDDSSERLRRWIAYVHAESLQQKWPFPTYFLWVCHPDEEMFVRPRPFGRLAKHLGLPWTFSGGASADTYAVVRAWSLELRDAMAAYGGHDLVDVQSAIWVAAQGLAAGAPPTALTGAELPVGESSTLGAPFDKMFTNRAEAEWAFDLLASGCERLDVLGPDDSRIATTLPYGGGHLHLNLGHWLMVGFEPLGSDNDLVLALLRDAAGVSALKGGTFQKPGGGDSPFAQKTLPRKKYQDSAELQTSLKESLSQLGQYFAGAKGSGASPHHVPELANAIFDESMREELLTLGLEGYRLQHGAVATDAAFTAEAHELLTAMAADPTKSFYAAYKDGLTKHVQEPVQQLLSAVAERIASPLREALETKKRLFGVFPKNDFGKGGAWPYYWGAFYPVGGKKTEGCQLYVFLDEEGFSYGFSIGNYASDDRKRFARNTEENREVIFAALRETINTPDFEFGNANESDSSNVALDIEGLDLAGWLERSNKVGPNARVRVPWHELLGIERGQLIGDVATAFDRLFPLVLLGTVDDPMPAIRAYMEGDLEEEGEIELNPPYSLDDLAAETSLPKKNLEAWLRAIARKGQAILYGPPGTGKTYVAERLAKHLVAGGTGTAELVQFHPAYAYEDFMQGMRPKARDGGGLDYPIMDGRFKQFCDQARGRTGVSVLIIDEVNRANLARVFGELMYLLEYRESSIPLAAGGRFSIPANVRLIGTMNTADRSIALVDHALRRRFAFLPLYPDYQMLADYHAKYGSGYNPAKLIELLKDLNRKIGDHHYEVGTSFFMRPDIADQLPDVWSMEIEPYLEEYFFDQRATVDSFRWDEVKKKLGAE